MEPKENRRSVAADWMGLLTAQPSLWVGSVLMTYLGGRLSEVTHFPLLWKVGFYVAASLLIISVISRVVLTMRAWQQGRAGQVEGLGQPGALATGKAPSNSKFTFIDAITASNNSFRDFHFMEDGGNPPGGDTPVVPSTAAQLRGLAARLRTLHTDWCSLMEVYESDPRQIPLPMEWQLPPQGPDLEAELARMNHETSQRRAEWEAAYRQSDYERAAVYRRSIEPRLVQLFEDARSRGFDDPELNAQIRTMAITRIGMRLGALAERVDVAADAM